MTWVPSRYSLAELKMYGLASASKHAALAEYGAEPVDYRTEDFVQVIRQLAPGGLDAVFDGMGGDYLPRGLGLLKRGGVWVSYANPRSLRGMVRLLGRVLWYNLRLDGRRVALYGTGASNLDRRPFLEGLGGAVPAARRGPDQTDHRRPLPAPGGSPGQRPARKRAGDGQCHVAGAGIAIMTRQS